MIRCFDPETGKAMVNCFDGLGWRADDGKSDYGEEQKSGFVLNHETGQFLSAQSAVNIRVHTVDPEKRQARLTARLKSSMRWLNEQAEAYRLFLIADRERMTVIKNTKYLK